MKQSGKKSNIWFSWWSCSYVLIKHLQYMFKNSRFLLDKGSILLILDDDVFLHSKDVTWCCSWAAGIHYTQGSCIHRNSPLCGWSCSYMCRCIMGQQRADGRLCALLPLCPLSCVCYKTVILIDQAKPSMVRQEKGGEVTGVKFNETLSAPPLLPWSQRESVRQVHSVWDPQLDSGQTLELWYSLCLHAHTSVWV